MLPSASRDIAATTMAVHRDDRGGELVREIGQRAAVNPLVTIVVGTWPGVPNCAAIRPSSASACSALSMSSGCTTTAALSSRPSKSDHSRAAVASSAEPSLSSVQATSREARARKPGRQCRPTRSTGRSERRITSSATLPIGRPPQPAAAMRGHAHDAIVGLLYGLDDDVGGVGLLRGHDFDRTLPVPSRDLLEILVGLERPVVLRREEQQPAADALCQRFRDRQRLLSEVGAVERHDERLGRHDNSPSAASGERELHRRVRSARSTRCRSGSRSG